jgi:hypothetical protein
MPGDARAIVTRQRIQRVQSKILRVLFVFIHLHINDIA